MKSLLLLIFISLLLSNNGLIAQVFTEQKSLSIPKSSSCSVTWGDYNKDGWLDLLVIRKEESKIYKNNGDNSFTEQAGLLYGVISSTTAAWGDYNNDGWLDILFTGDGKSVVYKNNGNNSFSQTDIQISGLRDGTAAWGDFNNDGWLDILITGIGYINYNVYRNNGDGTFSNPGFKLFEMIVVGPGMWGDFNNDGWLDALTAGGGDARLIKNNRDGTFSTYKTFKGFYEVSVAKGDCNNDGWLDILMSGHSDYGYNTITYINNGDGTFTELIYDYKGPVTWADCNNDGWIDIIAGPIIYKNKLDGTFDWQNGISIPGSCKSFADYDNDGDLDLLLTETGDSIALFRNDSGITNNPPIPSGLIVSIVDTCAVLKWNKVIDNENASQTFTYNVRVGTTPGGNNIVNSFSNSNGVRSVVNLGNAQDTFLIMNNPPDKYYWSVQAINKSYIGGSFSAENSFNISTAFTDNSDSDIQVFPNPVSSFIYVNNLKGKTYGEILNSQGIKVKTALLSDPNNQINVSDLPKDFYLMCIEEASQFFYYKFIKE